MAPRGGRKAESVKDELGAGASCFKSSFSWLRFSDVTLAISGVAMYARNAGMVRV
jgi:hypothetical protein